MNTTSVSAINASVQSQARDISRYFRKGYYADSWDFVYLDDRAPDWVARIWRESGINRMVPEQYRSRFFKASIDALSKHEDFQAAMDSLPYGDGEYGLEISKWLHSESNRRMILIDECAAKYGIGNGIAVLMGQAFREELSSMFNRVLVRLIERVKSLRDWSEIEV